MRIGVRFVIAQHILRQMLRKPEGMKNPFGQQLGMKTTVKGTVQTHEWRVIGACQCAGNIQGAVAVDVGCAGLLEADGDLGGFFVHRGADLRGQRHKAVVLEAAPFAVDCQRLGGRL